MVPFALLQYKAFMRFWFARVATTMGNQMMMVAVAWQMYELTNSAWDLGLVGLVQFLPSLALSLVVGQVADRYDRRWILSACLLGQFLVAAILIFGSVSGWIGRELILSAAVLLGVTKAFQMPTQQALAPLLVPAPVLARALAFSASGSQFAIITGPALGGFIFIGGANAVYGVCSALFLCAAVLFASIQIQRTPPPKEPLSMNSLFAGVRFIWQRPDVLGAITLDLFAVLLGGATALLPIFAKDILHVGPWGLGLLRGAPAIGALLMSIWLTRYPVERQVGKILFRSVAVYGLATLVFALSTSFLLSMLVLAISGAADMISVVIRQSLVQLDTPDAMRGRVSAVNSIFIGASNQLGEFESGATAAMWGAVPSVVVGGLGTLAVVGLCMKCFPGLAKRDRMVSDPSPA